MKRDLEIPELDDIVAILSQLPSRDVSPACSRNILAQAHGILLRQKRMTMAWKEWLATFYTRFLEPALVSSVVLFYIMWAFGRAAVLLHL